MDFEQYTWTGSVSVDWDDIFYTVSPLLIHEAVESDIRKALNGLIKEHALPTYKNNENAKGHRFSNFLIENDDFHTILVQLRALGLMTQSIRNRSVKDTATYWTLTPYGDATMVNLRAIEKFDSPPKPSPKRKIALKKRAKKKISKKK